MDFRKALTRALHIAGESAVDPTLLYYALCDVVGNDLILKPQAESFHHFNKTCQIVETMAKEPDPRMILTLLEKCKEQPDAPEKLCLRWIHTVFEIYYRANHGDQAQTEQVLKSIEQDFIEPEQEGLHLPNPRKKKLKPVRGHRLPAASPAAPQAQRATPPPRATPIGQGAAGANAPLPGAVYKVLPDDVCVYKAESDRHLHVSPQCPSIRPALNQTLYHATYDRARYKDYVTVNGITKNTTAIQGAARSHLPPVCAICGGFTPILFRKPTKITYKQL